ncbi:MAG: carboxymuconolactone decarboxylase family protein, partial [Dehalococcoidia bacterium]
VLARRLGLPEEQATELRNWQSSSHFDPREKAALAYTDAMVQGGAIPEAVGHEVEKQFDAEELVELTMTAAFYIGLARYLAAIGVELEPGYERLTERQ